MTAFVNHFLFEFRTGIRNKQLLLMNYLFPLGFFLMMGFVMGGGTDIALESADIALMNDSAISVVEAIGLSRLTMANIRQNLTGAFLYNALCIPVAAGILFPFFGILLSPVFAGAAMAMSSVTVVTNANRLRYTRLRV